VRFTSEWRRDPLPAGWFADPERERFLWWGSVAGAEAALPADGRVWHHHPTRLLSLLGTLPTAAPPPATARSNAPPAAPPNGPAGRRPSVTRP
jgi:hypothetical protein